MPKYYQFDFTKMNEDELVVSRDLVVHGQPDELSDSFIYKILFHSLASLTFVIFLSYFILKVLTDKPEDDDRVTETLTSVVMGLAAAFWSVLRSFPAINYQAFLVERFAQAEVKKISRDILESEYALLQRTFPESLTMLADRCKINSIDDFVSYFENKIYGLCEGYVSQFIQDMAQSQDLAPTEILKKMSLPNVIRKQIHHEICAGLHRLLSEDESRKPAYIARSLRESLAKTAIEYLKHPLLLAVSTNDSFLDAPISADILYRFLCHHFNKDGFVSLTHDSPDQSADDFQVEEVDLQDTVISGKLAVQFRTAKPKHGFAYSFSKSGLLFFDCNSGLYDFPDTRSFCKGVSRFINDKCPDVAMVKASSMVFKK